MLLLHQRGVSFLYFLLLQTLTVAGHYSRCDNVLQLCLFCRKTIFFHLIKDEEAKMVTAWELKGGREMLFLWELAKDLCLCLFR